MRGLTYSSLVLAGVLGGLSGCQIDNPAFTISAPDPGSSGATTDATGDAPTTTGPDATGTTEGPPDTDTAALSSTTPAPVCGDAVVDPGESCDDGNELPGDGCEPDCSLTPPPGCGDGVVAGDEACDDGNASDHDDCTNQCKDAACGDGVVHEGVETCDDGDPSDTNDCTSACHKAFCGDGFLHDGVEACDDGNDADGDGCTATCALEEQAACGDGLISSGEDCEPTGPLAPFCSAGCTFKVCADLVNTEATDITTNDWFDGCFAARGATLHLAVLDEVGQPVYYGKGTIPDKDFFFSSPDKLTSTVAFDKQWNLGLHTPIELTNPVDLAQKDLLYLTGRSSKGSPLDCIHSFGQGYGLTLVAKGAPIGVVRMLLMSHAALTQAGTPERAFVGWSAGSELALVKSPGFSPCAEGVEMAALKGRVLLAVTE